MGRTPFLQRLARELSIVGTGFGIGFSGNGILQDRLSNYLIGTGIALASILTGVAIDYREKQKKKILSGSIEDLSLAEFNDVMREYDGRRN